MFVDSKQTLYSPSFILPHLCYLSSPRLTHTHTLPPPTLPHPAHHCLVNLFKTPICLSDLSGSFKWLRISPGTKAPLLGLLNPSPHTKPACFCSASVTLSRQSLPDLPASSPSLRPCSPLGAPAFPSYCHCKFKSENHSGD